MILAAFGLGAAFALSGVWLGFYLARMELDAAPSIPKLPETFEGNVLDLAVYPGQVIDDE